MRERRAARQLVPDGPRSGLVLLVALVILVGGAGVWMIIESRERVQAHILEEHSMVARLEAGLVAAELSARLRLIESYATRPSVIEAAERGDWAEIDRQLERFLREDDDFAGAAATDAEGAIRALHSTEPSMAGNESPYRDIFYRAIEEEEPFVSDAFFLPGAQRRFGVAFSARVEAASGSVLGLLQGVSEVSRGNLIPSLGRQARDIKIFDKRGTPIVGHEIGGLSSGSRHFGVTEALHGESGAGLYRDPGSEEDFIGGYAPVPGVRWALLSEEPHGRAWTSIRPLLYQLGSIGVAVLVAAGVIGWLLLRLLRRLAAERNRSETLLVSMADGVLVTDVEGRIILMNPAMEEMIGWSLEEARGRIAQEVTGFSAGSAQRTKDVLEDIFARLRAGQVVSPTENDHTICSRGGRAIPIKWTAAPLSDDEGVTGIVSVLRDASRDRESDQLKASIVSTVSHELRTPLTMIQGFAELMGSRDLPEPSRAEAIAQIHSASERLSRLIDDLLSVTKIESGRLTMEFEEVDLASVLDEALARFSPDERMRVLARGPAGLPPLIADRNALIQILTNLVANALVYSPEDGPVEIDAARYEATIEIVVADRGIGLAPEDQARVFDKFFRADDSDVRRSPGTGLGLYITRSLVEVHGGRIWVDSEPGQGSRFHLVLPCVQEIALPLPGERAEAV